MASGMLLNDPARGQSIDATVSAPFEQGAQDELTSDPEAGDAKIGGPSFAINGGGFSVFPVPAVDRLSVFYTAAKDGQLTLQMMNAQGQPVTPLIQTLVSEGQQRKFSFNVIDLPNGQYVVRAIQSSSVLARHVIVAH